MMRAMKIATVIVRVVLGLAFTVFGLNFFLDFIPKPPPPSGLVGEYLHVLVASKYFYVIGAVQLVSGILLLIGRFVPLGLTLLAAMIFNILAFHILMDPNGIAPGIIVALLWAFLFWRYRERFAGILRP